MNKLDFEDKYLKMKCLLREGGYFKYTPKNGSSRRSSEIVQVSGKKVSPMGLGTLYLSKMECLPEGEKENSLKKSFAEIYAFDFGAFRADLEENLDDFEGPFLSDTTGKTYLFYTDTALEITAKEIAKIKYDDLAGYVWADQIVDHDFNSLPLKSVKDSALYEIFSELSTFVFEDIAEPRKQHLISMIGCLLNDSCDRSDQRLFFINDTTFHCSVTEGNTGKSLILEAIGRVIPTVFLDGTYLNSTIATLCKISAGTRLLVYKDVSSWDPDAVQKILETYPKLKICILTRYPLEDQGVNQFSVFPSYTEDCWPRLHLNHDLIKEMQKPELDQLYNLLAFAAQYYLNRGLVESPEINCGGMNSLIQETSLDFVMEMKKIVQPLMEYSWIQLFHHFVRCRIIENDDMDKFKSWVYADAATRNYQVVEIENIADKNFRFDVRLN